MAGDEPTGVGIGTVNGIKELIRQGICVNNGYLYRVYGKKVDGHITKNYIVKWILTGPQPEYTGCTLVDMYKCVGGPSGPFLFEIEGISMFSNQMHAAARIADTDGSSLFKAKLYKVSL